MTFGFRPGAPAAALLLVTVQSLAAAGAARAQAPAPAASDRRYAAVTAGASLGDGEAAPAFDAALAFALTDRIALELDLAYARRLDFTLDLCPAPLVCIQGGQLPVTGRTVALIPHLVVDLGQAGGRVRPYVAAGVGVAHLRQRYFGASVDRVGIAVVPSEFTRSAVVPALSAGGGLVVRLAQRVGIGLDARVLALLDEEPAASRFIVPGGTLTMVRSGARVWWRF